MAYYYFRITCILSIQRNSTYNIIIIVINHSLILKIRAGESEQIEKRIGFKMMRILVFFLVINNGLITANGVCVRYKISFSCYSNQIIFILS